jgi:hypothetical protein
MSDAALPPASLLPPPSATILLYAADGLAAWKEHLGPKGFPQMPARAIWVPMFRELVNSEEGMHTLHALARSGMEAWRCSPDNIHCLKSAFRDITLRALIIATLDDFAETGCIRILMPPPPSRPQPPTHAPRPEFPKPKSNGTPNSAPRRPSGQHKNLAPRPG